MFSNFKDAFVRKPQYTVEPPQAVIDAISKDLPDGFTYKYDHDGVCILDSKDGLNFNSGKVVLPKKALDLFSNEKSIDADKLKRYVYNSQTAIKLKPNEDGCFVINGDKIKAQDIFKAPLKDYDMKDIEITIVPPKFPDPIEVLIQGDGCELRLKMQRKAINSVDEIVFGTIEDNPLKFDYILNTKTEDLKLTISVEGIKYKTVSDAVAANHIFNAFALGRGYMDGCKVEINTPNRGLISKERIKFWDNLLELEKYLEISFEIDSEIYIEEVNKTYELYRSFIEKKPFKRYEEFKSAKGRCSAIYISENFDIIGKEINFEFEEVEEIELFGVQLKYYGLKTVFGVTVKSINMLDKDKISFDMELTTTPGKKSFISIMYFKDEEKLKEYRVNKERIAEFEKAEVLEYINE